MEPVTRANIQIDRCSNCKGLWFDELELDHLRVVRDAASVDSGDRRIGREMNAKGAFDCPRCLGPTMLRLVDVRQPHIWYEKCTVCQGVWFDAGEFSDLTSETVVDLVRDRFTRERA
jgi:Zn-finger nucleic acid-binding protein